MAEEGDEVTPAGQRIGVWATVLKDLRLTGWEFIRDVLAGLEKGDDTAFRELGYERWPEEKPRSPKNDAYILRVVEDVVQRRQ